MEGGGDIPVCASPPEPPGCARSSRLAGWESGAVAPRSKTLARGWKPPAVGRKVLECTRARAALDGWGKSSRKQGDGGWQAFVRVKRQFSTVPPFGDEAGESWPFVKLACLGVNVVELSRQLATTGDHDDQR